MSARHPAKYNGKLLATFAHLLSGNERILDPFAGTGKIFELLNYHPELSIEGIEIEPEWSRIDSRVTAGNALYLPWNDNEFDMIITSPTYGNRMADHHRAKDNSIRNTYTHCLGRKLHPDNSGAMQWGDAYRAFHRKAWLEARRVLKSGGTFVLNCKNFYRNGELVEVTEWHIETLESLGFYMLKCIRVDLPGNGFGQNGKLRVGHESVVALGWS